MEGNFGEQYVQMSTSSPRTEQLGEFISQQHQQNSSSSSNSPTTTEQIARFQNLSSFVPPIIYYSEEGFVDQQQQPLPNDIISPMPSSQSESQQHYYASYPHWEYNLHGQNQQWHQHQGQQQFWGTSSTTAAFHRQQMYSNQQQAPPPTMNHLESTATFAAIPQPVANVNAQIGPVHFNYLQQLNAVLLQCDALSSNSAEIPQQFIEQKVALLRYLTPEMIEMLEEKQLNQITAEDVKQLNPTQLTFVSPKYKKRIEKAMSAILVKNPVKKEANVMEVFNAMVAVEKFNKTMNANNKNDDDDQGDWDWELKKRKRQQQQQEIAYRIEKKYEELPKKINCIEKRLGELIYQIDEKYRDKFCDMMAAPEEEWAKWANRNCHFLITETKNRWPNDPKNLNVKKGSVWLFSGHISAVCMALIIKRAMPVTKCELKDKLECLAGCDTKICINPFHHDFIDKTPLDHYRDKAEVKKSQLAPIHNTFPP